MLVLKKEGIMPLYDRLNAHIFMSSAAIILRVYEFVSRLPRVIVTRSWIRIHLEDSVRCLPGRELHVPL